MEDYAAIIFCICLFGVSILQILLFLGKPYGEYAWGGQDKILPNKLRIASFINVLVYVVLSLIILNGAGLVEFFNDSFTKISMWFLVGFSILAVLMNSVSRSKKERNLMAPIALVMLACSVIVLTHL